jgi:hypothetical protein
MIRNLHTRSLNIVYKGELTPSLELILRFSIRLFKVKMTLGGSLDFLRSQLIIMGLLIQDSSKFDDSDLILKVIPSGLVEEDKLSLTWEVLSFESKFMMIQIYFDNPLYISSNGRDDLEKLSILCTNPKKFVKVSDEI